MSMFDDFYDPSADESEPRSLLAEYTRLRDAMDIIRKERHEAAMPELSYADLTHEAIRHIGGIRT